jgi:GNAT superfamily N-acetyltransferase
MTNADNLPGLHIRQAQIGEADELTRLVMESKAHWDYTQEQLAMWRGELTVPSDVINAGQAYVGVIDGTLVAMMALIPAVMTWELSYFFVGPAWMKRGIGKSMFQFAIETAQKKGARAVRIDADPNAEPFYLSCGAIRSHVISAPIAADANRIRPQMLLVIPTRKAGLPG